MFLYLSAGVGIYGERVRLRELEDPRCLDIAHGLVRDVSAHVPTGLDPASEMLGWPVGVQNELGWAD